MRSLTHFFIILIFPYFISVSKIYAQEQELPDNEPVYTLFLIGDAGEPFQDSQDPNLALLESQITLAGKESAVVFLGDNIYPRGLPDENRKGRTAAESRLLEQLKIVKDYPGKIIFVPGNHDWDRGGRYGWENVKIQQEYIENYLQRDSVFLPLGGCPGPVELKLNDHIILIAFDTQWFLHKWDKPGQGSSCTASERDAAFEALGASLEANKELDRIVVSHHPMFSAGTHGGHTTWIEHIFPLTLVKPYLFIPLPVIGSIVPLYRKFHGHIQDIPHPEYSKMRRSMLEQLEKYPNLIHAAGHEHTLQHFIKNEVHHVVSGSGTKSSSLKKHNDAEFASPLKGFAKISYYKNKETWLEFWVPSREALTGEMIHRERLSID